MSYLGKFLRFAAAPALLLAALGVSPLQAQTVVKVGVIGAISDAPFYIGDKKGYFKEQGIQIDFVNFKDSGQMTAPLGVGELDVAAGATSAGLYNAILRGIDIRAVADKGSMPKNYGYMPLMVRKELVDSGRFKSLKDLKGLKMGSQSPGGGATATLMRALAQGGLKFEDVQVAYMGHPQLALAIDNGAIDAALITEPNATNAVRLGHTVRFARGDEIYPDQQLAVVLYSGKFMKEKTDTAKKFMVAYLKSARAYNDALKDGKFAGPAADDVISILTASTEVKDASLYREIVPGGCNPDGKLNLESLQADLDVFREQGLVKENITAAQLVDTSFAEAALKQLGPYKPAQ
jgi:NitT/TauT family transport system substrate-binding protein